MISSQLARPWLLYSNVFIDTIQKFAVFMLFGEKQEAGNFLDQKIQEGRTEQDEKKS